MSLTNEEIKKKEEERIYVFRKKLLDKSENVINAISKQVLKERDPVVARDLDHILYQQRLVYGDIADAQSMEELNKSSGDILYDTVTANTLTKEQAEAFNSQYSHPSPSKPPGNYIKDSIGDGLQISTIEGGQFGPVTDEVPDAPKQPSVNTDERGRQFISPESIWEKYEDKCIW